MGRKARWSLPILMVLAAGADAQDWREQEKRVGLGAYIRPAYVGADSMRTEPIPLLRVYGEHWFARTTQGQLEGGYRIGLTSALTAGAQLSYEPGRRTKDSALRLPNPPRPDCRCIPPVPAFATPCSGFWERTTSRGTG